MRNKTGNGTRNRMRLLVIILILLLAMTALLAVNHRLDQVGYDPVGTTIPSSIRIDPGAGEAVDGGYAGRTHEEILDDLQKRQVLVTDRVSSHASFPLGAVGSLGEWVVENAAGNTVIQQAEIYLEGTCVARSAAIRPGQHVDRIRLLEAVPPGTHNAVVCLNYFTEDTQSYISQAGFTIKVTVAG